jgi:hypothetical protein
MATNNGNRLTPSQVSTAREACLSVRRQAGTFWKRPFAAVLLGPDNETTLLDAPVPSIKATTLKLCLARLAYSHYPKDFLWTYALLSTLEWFAMCTATLYWTHIGGAGVWG